MRAQCAVAADSYWNIQFQYFDLGELDKIFIICLAHILIIGSVCSLLSVQGAIRDLGDNSFQWTFKTGMLFHV